MAVNQMLRLILVLCQFALVLLMLIDPKSLKNGSGDFTVCLGNSSVIQIKDPYPKSTINGSKFFAMEWFRYRQEEGKKIEISLLIFIAPFDNLKLYSPRYSVFEFWGLQINNVDISDSAVYKPKLVTLADNEELFFHINVVDPPDLESDRLSITRVANEVDNSVTLSCGKIASLGSPPISIKIKAGNGTLLPTVYNDGYFQLTLPSTEAESGKFTCEMNMSAPTTKCIDKKDLSRWYGAVIGKTASARLQTWVIAGSVAGALAFISISIIIIVVVVRQRKAKSYNAKGHNGRNLSKNNSSPLLTDKEVHYAKPSIARSPIYKGPIDPGPYMVSRVSEENDDPNYHDPDAEYEEINCGNGDRSQSCPNSGVFFKKREEKIKPERNGAREKSNRRDIGKEKDEQIPPRTKPRSIFLTPSMEELDKISRAVAGGEGSQRSDAIGTQV